MTAHRLDLSGIGNAVLAHRRAVARAPIGVSDEAMTGAWRAIIARTPDLCMVYYYHENNDANLKAVLRAQAESWIGSHKNDRDRRRTLRWIVLAALVLFWFVVGLAAFVAWLA